MKLKLEKEKFEKYLIEKSDLYLSEKNELNEAIR